MQHTYSCECCAATAVKTVTCAVEHKRVEHFLQLVSTRSHTHVLAVQNLHLLRQVADLSLQLVPLVSQSVPAFGDLINQVGVLCVPPINRAGVCNRVEENQLV